MHFRFLAAAIAVSALQYGCGDSTGPTSGSLRVTTETTGAEVDPDGYVLVLNDGQRSSGITADGTVTFADLRPGDHTVQLTDVAVNCSIAGDNPRELEVTAGGTTRTTFSASCSATTVSVSITVLSPLGNERFIQGESVPLAAAVQTDPPAAAAELTWSSSVDGILGVGEALSADLSAGTHTISASMLGSTAQVPVRVFADLGAFYRAPPAQGEISRILNDFDFHLIDTNGTDESWDPYDDSVFDQSSTDPANLAILARLDVLRHQHFTVPLPIVAPGTTIYEHLKTYVRDFFLYLDCRIATGGAGRMSLPRNASVWDSRQSGHAADPDACKRPFQIPQLAPYVGTNQLIVHETRHSEPSDPGHTCCGGSCGKDSQFENGSGYASGAIYYMWVYKYGVYDPQPEKDRARSGAVTLLTSRFCTPPTHSDPLVQALLDELL